MISAQSRQTSPPRWLAPAIAISLLAIGTLAPLSDPDLPLHLAMGEWVVRHHHVPFAEPFAWSRWGAPYYAYSWLAEVGYYLAWRAGGPLALQVLHGVVFASTFLVIFALGRAARWNPWATLAVAIGNVWMLGAYAAYLRPQALLLVLVPLAWAFGYLILDAQRRWWLAAIGLFATSALVANTHLFFVATALPCWLLLTRPFPRTRDARLRAAALLVTPILGWITTPYGAMWVTVFRLFFAPNPMMRWPSPIAELQPGVLALRGSPDLAACVLVLLALPWIRTRSVLALSTRERVVFAILWTLGLIGFAGALRLAIIWWLAVLPWLGIALSAIPAPQTADLRLARTATALIIALVPSLLVIRRPPEWYPPARGISGPRTLPILGSVTEPLAAWLEAHAPGRHGRIMTTFNYGSYLLWRLPGYSMSIDSRGIFPDSVLNGEAFYLPTQGRRALGPWRSADIVIIPRNYELASVLDTAQGWAHVANAPIHDDKVKNDKVKTARDTTPPGAPGLWVRTRWLSGAERAQ